MSFNMSVDTDALRRPARCAGYAASRRSLSR